MFFDLGTTVELSERCEEVILTGGKIRSGELLPVRSSSYLPKEKILQCMEIIKKTSVSLPVKQYDVVVKNICDTGVDIVATKTLKRKPMH